MSPGDDRDDALPMDIGIPVEKAPADGAGCHAGNDAMREAAAAAGNSDVLERYARDYPLDPKRGPHDQPQSMCPAFGSLRVGLRMRRTASVLSGSACCVYGLTFTSHFYGARRSVGYVPFNSETLVTGKLFEDIKEAVEKLADPALYDAIVITNLCVPTASGVPLKLLPKAIDGVRIIGIDVPGFGVPTHAEAKDVLAGAMLAYARAEAEQGPVLAPRDGPAERPTVTLLGEMFPVDPVTIGAMLEPMGLAAGPVVPTREWRWTARRWPRSTRSTPRRCASSAPPGAPCCRRRRSAATAPPRGWTRSPTRATSRTRSATPRSRRCCRRSAARCPRCP